MPNRIFEDIQKRMNFDTLFAKNKILTDGIRTSFKRPAAPEDEAWKATGWMEDLSAYLEGPDLQGNSEEVNSSLRELSEGVKHIKEELTSVKKLRSSAKDLPFLKKMQARLDEFHRLTDYNYVMDPHFQALGGLIREFKSILDQRRNRHLDEEIEKAAKLAAQPVDQLPDDLVWFNSELTMLTEKADRQHIVLDKDVLDKQIKKLEKEIKKLEKKQPKGTVSMQTALLHQVPHAIGFLSEEGMAKLNLERKVMLIDRMAKLDANEAEKQKKERKTCEVKLAKLGQKSGIITDKLIENLVTEVRQYALKKGLIEDPEKLDIREIDLNTAGKEDPKVFRALKELGQVIIIEDQEGKVSGTVILDRKTVDGKIIKEILKYEKDALKDVSSTDELKKAWNSVLRKETDGGKMTIGEVQDEIAGVENALKHPDIPGPEILRKTLADMKKMKTKLEELEKAYPQLKERYNKKDEPITVSRPVTEQESREIIEQLAALYDKREAAKGDHTNSTEYDRMVEAINTCQTEGPTFENMENLQQQAQRYLDAKLKWDMFHLKPTKLRYERLDYAREIIEFAKQNKKLYEPAQIPDKIIERYKDAAIASRSDDRDRFIGDPDCTSMNQLIRKQQTTTKEDMEAHMDQQIRGTYAAMGLKPAKEKGSQKVL